ncbi:hypothetical protein ABIF75_004510 [Bradyrhizobium japonicum]
MMPIGVGTPRRTTAGARCRCYGPCKKDGWQQARMQRQFFFITTNASDLLSETLPRRSKAIVRFVTESETLPPINSATPALTATTTSL